LTLSAENDTFKTRNNQAKESGYMDYNQNNQNNPNDSPNQDRWNSSASDSSYYNQPTHRPYGQGFLIASMICGALSVTACCTGFLSLPLGALGILFAMLTYRRGKRMSGQTATGIVLSCAGIVTGISMIIYSFSMLPSMMQDPVFRNQVDTMTQRLYGMDFAEFMEHYYGYELDAGE